MACIYNRKPEDRYCEFCSAYYCDGRGRSAKTTEIFTTTNVNLLQEMDKMKLEDKEILLKELHTRSHYGVRVQVCNLEYAPILKGVLNDEVFVQFDFNRPIRNGDSTYNLVKDEVKPYLRSFSSMTDEELHELQEIVGEGVEIRDGFLYIVDSSRNSLSYLELLAVFDWLNAHHFDYRGLIERGLAIEAPKDMYN